MRCMGLIVILALLVSGSCSMERLYQMGQKQKISPYEQVNFSSMVKRYLDKEQSSAGSIEGIYAVSSLITKKGKSLLSPVEKEKVLDRRENYSQVAIIRDKGNPNREYFEVPLDNDLLPSYAVRGEFTGVSDGNMLVYKHFEPRGKTLNYTFVYDREHDLLEGVRTENQGSATITYKLTYIKLFPKAGLNASN